MTTATQPTTSLIDTLTARVDEIQGESLEKYKALVRDAADGADVDPDDAVAILQGVDKTAAQLAEDIRGLEYRRALQEQASEEGDLRDQIAELNSGIDKAKTRLEKSVQKEQAAIAELSQERDALQLKLHHAERASQQLIKSCDDVTLADEMSDVLAELRDATYRQGNARQRLEYVTKARRHAEFDLRNAQSAKAVKAAEKKLESLETVEVSQNVFAKETAARERLEASETDCRKRMALA